MAAAKRIHLILNRISEKADLATRWVCISLILFMTAEVIVAVFFRYALDAPLKWGEELARLCMVWSGLLGIAIALKEGDHVGLEILQGRLQGRPKAVCKLMAYGCIIPFLIILIIWGIKISQVAWGTFMPALQIKWTWSHLAVPVTAAIQLLHLVPKAFTEILALAGDPGAAWGEEGRLP